MIGDITGFPLCTVYKPYALFHSFPLSLALSGFILQAPHGLIEFLPKFSLYFLQWEAINLSLLASLTQFSSVQSLSCVRLLATP